MHSFAKFQVTLKEVFTVVLPIVIHLCSGEECSRNSDCDHRISNRLELLGYDQCCDGYCKNSCSTLVDLKLKRDFRQRDLS